MTLIACPDCGKQVSDQAPACIHCGKPLARDLLNKPTAGSAKAVKEGRQRSVLRYDLGNAIGFIGVVVAVIAGIVAGSFTVGIVTALVTVGIGVWIAYGS